MGHKFSKTLSICFLALCIICTLSSCSKIPFLSSFFSGSESSSVSASSSSEAEPIVIEYQEVTVNALHEELENNILRAEHKYQDEYVEIPGILAGISSEDQYFLLIDLDNGFLQALDPNYILCSITDASNVDILLEKNIGDIITVRGQITNIDSSSGYSLDLIEVIATDANEN